MLIRHKLFAVYITVLILGLGLSGMVYQTGDKVSQITKTLVDTQLPRLKLISSIREITLEQERTLYEYYATTDRVNLIGRIHKLQTSLADALQNLKNISPENNNQHINTLLGHYIQIESLANELDRILSAKQISWNNARSLLIDITRSGQAANPILQQLTQQLESEVVIGSENSRASVKTINWLAIIFSFVIFSIVLMIGYYVNRYIKTSAERRRLETFPERNPNPVLCLRKDGQIEYKNPAFQALEKKILGDDQRGELILPGNYQHHIESMLQNKQALDSYEYEYAGHIFEYRVHVLRDLEKAHIYLNDITDRQIATDKIQFQAMHDSLTDLPNRAYFEKELEEQLKQSSDERQTGVMLIRIDKFARIASTYGRDIGDGLLIEIGKRTQQLLEIHQDSTSKYQLFRFDDMTFAVLIHNLRDLPQAKELGNIMTAGMEKVFKFKQHKHYLKALVGLTIGPLQGIQVMDLIRNADTAIAHALQEENSDFAVYNIEMHEAEERWLDLERGLKTAITNNELKLVYQPKINLKRNTVSGSEALLRWQLPSGEMVSPVEFIPVAEQSGLILPIGDWVLNEACRQAKEWVDEGLMENITVAVNISARQFQAPGFIEIVKQTLQNHQLSSKYLELEITESLIIHDINRSIDIMAILKSMGVTLSIDDFGTGYSSLSYLKQFPIDKLKVDQSFIRNITSHAEDAAIVHSIISLAHNLNLKVVTEGVETEQQLDIITHYGSEEVQGYYYSKPLDKEDMYEYLSRSTEELLVC